jgi:hypothetical protein
MRVLEELARSGRGLPPHRTPQPFLVGRFRGRGLPPPPCDYFEPGAPVGDKGIVRKLTFFGGSGDPLKKRILPHHAPPQSWKQESIYRIIAAPIRVYYGIIRIDRAESS